MPKLTGRPADIAAGEWLVLEAGELRVLLAALPSGQIVTLRLVVTTKRGGQDGGGYWWGWNGDKDRPSLRNSIQGDSWHGFLDKGEFVTGVSDEDGEDWW